MRTMTQGMRYLIARLGFEAILIVAGIFHLGTRFHLEDHRTCFLFTFGVSVPRGSLLGGSDHVDDSLGN